MSTPERKHTMIHGKMGKKEFHPGRIGKKHKRKNTMLAFLENP